MSKQPTMKRKILDMKDKLRIIEAFDKKVITEGKVNKKQFAAQYGLSMTSFGSILNNASLWKLRQRRERLARGEKK